MANDCRTLIFVLALFASNIGNSSGGAACVWDWQCSSGEACSSKYECVKIEVEKVETINKVTTVTEKSTKLTTTTTTPPPKNSRVDSSLFEEKVLVNTKESFYSSEEEKTEEEKPPTRGDIPVLTVHPEYQEVYKDDTVLVSCRDESNSRFKVRWSRLSDAPLPKNAHDHNDGTLEIRKVTVDNSGSYICTTVDGPDGIKQYKKTFILVKALEWAVEKPWGAASENKNISIRAVNTGYSNYNRYPSAYDNYYASSTTTARVPYTRPTVTNYPRQFSHFPKALKVSPSPSSPAPITAQNAPCNFTAPSGKCCYTRLYCVECDTTTTTTPSPGSTPGYTTFKCANGDFIDIELKCNRQNDCSDGSDEYLCPTAGPTTFTIPPTQPTTVSTPQGCGLNEFECSSGQCIKNIKYCDGEMDCLDKSDEPSTCKENWPPKIIELPRLKTELNCVDPSEPMSVPRNALQLECKFVGEPIPKVFWKKYESYVPAKCLQSSRGGHGTLFCPDFEPSDQGAYSCVAENAAGAAESQPKSISVCSNPITCNNGFKLIDEQNIENCFECYCSNKTKDCHNIKSIKKVEKIPFPETKVEVLVSKNGSIAFIPSDEEFFAPSEIQSSSEPVTYCSVHDSILNKHSFVKSYGRSIIIPRRFGFPNFALDAPDLIIRGHGLALTYSYKKNLGTSPKVDVRFWRGHFHHVDKTVATRFDLMRVLANIDALLIRCEYRQGVTDEWDGKEKEIELESAIIEEDADSTSYLERCICPTGYSGLSCEVCAPDYEREKGTDICVKKPEPPPTPQQCDEGYIGEDCDDCDEDNGYYYSESKGRCSKVNCNEIGRMGSNLDLNGKCICKEHVTGEECDTCKRGSFNLNAKVYTGCSKCWCNDVSEECESSNWRRSYISSTSYGGYNSSDGRNFWLLPAEFNGNRLTSYGGRLDYTIKYAPNIAKQERVLEVEILSKDNNSIVYYHPDVDTSTDKDIKSWSVKIEEQFWRNRDGKILSRFEILKALVNVKAIYIESPYHLSSGLANLTSVKLDIAEKDGDGILATDVEVCKCPEGYKGLSCEKCDKGFMRDKNNPLKCVKCPCTNCDPEEGCLDCPEHYYDENYNNKSLGRDCRPCPCSNNDKSCFKDDYDQIICSCKAGYSGMKCESKAEPEIKSRLKVTISPNKVKNVRTGTTIIFNCSYESTEKMIIRFKKVYSGKSGNMDNGFESQSEGPESANQFGSMRSLAVVLDEGLTHVECFVFNSLDMEVGRVMAVIEGVVGEFKPPEITNCYVGSHKVKEEGTLSLSCEATGSPTPEIIWYKNDVRVKTVDGVLSIENANLSDGGIYRCEARNQEGNDACSHSVIVEKKCLILDIIPGRVRAEEGDDINLLCKASEDGRISWKRLDKDLPEFDFRYSTHNNGRLSITNATTEDSGEFVCVFTNKETTMNKTVTVIVERKRTKPTASIVESDSTVNTGQDFEINCVVTGYPEPTVSWKFDLLSNVEIANNGKKLVIKRAKLENQGIYQCFAISSEGNASAPIYIAVRDSQKAPRIAIRPNSVIALEKGESVDVECEVLEGAPAPIVGWVRLDGKPVFPEGNFLRFSRLKISDSGRYVCIATNSAGRAEASMEIDVLYPPKVTVNPTEIREVKGAMVMIYCEAEGNPIPRLRWKEDLKPRHLKRTAQDNSNNQTDMLLPRKRLGIEVQVSEEIYQYTCIAENNVGRDQASIQVHVLPETEEPETGDAVSVELGTPYTIKCEGVTGKVVWSKLNGNLQGDECERPDGLFIPSVQVQHRGTYICKSAINPSIKKSVTLHVKGYVNKFSNEQNSFMVLPMKTNSSSYAVEMTFRPGNPNGLLLLEKENQKFVVYLKDGRVHARLNLDEPVELLYDAYLTLAKWYSLILTLENKEANLLVYGEDGIALLDDLLIKDIKSFNWGSIKEFYVGGTNKTKKDFETMNYFESVPFEGCVSRLVVDEYEYPITQEGVYSRNVALCKRCQEDNPCKNAGECMDAPSHYGFICVCPNGHIEKETTTCPPSCAGLGCSTKVDFCTLLNPCNSKGSDVNNCIAVGRNPDKPSTSFHCHCAVGYSGTRCDKVEEFSFTVSGNGYAQLDSKFLDRTDLSKPDEIEIEFTPSNTNGVLLWQGDNSDYLYIGLNDGLLEYVYYNQKIALELTGKLISLGHNHRLVSTRNNNTVELVIDDNRYRASADFSTNRVKGNIYLGNSPGSVHGRFNKGFSGCINKVAFGKSKVNILQEGVQLHNAEKKCSSQNEIELETNEVEDFDYLDSENVKY